MPARFVKPLLLLVLWASFGLRIANMPYGLPYVDHPDEPNFYLMSNDWRGKLDAYWRNDWLIGYPPGYIWFNQAVIMGVDAISENNIHTDMGKYIAIGRTVSILLDMLTLSFIIIATTWLAGRTAALLAASIYAFSAAAIQYIFLALPDPLTTTLTVACVVVSLHAFRRNSLPWGVAATIVGLVAIIVKYPAAPVLIMPAVFFLWQLKQSWRRALLPAALALVLVLLVAYSLFFVYGAVGLKIIEAQHARQSLLAFLLTPERWSAIFKELLRYFGAGSVLIGAAALVMLVQRRRMVNHWLILLTGAAGVLLLTLVTGYWHPYRNYVPPTRYMLPPMPVLIITFAAFIGQTLLPKSKDPAPRWLLALLVLPMLSMLPETFAFQQKMQKPLTYTTMQFWLEENIPDGSTIWTAGTGPYGSLSRYERGYSGFKNFDPILAVDEQNTRTIDEADYLYVTGDELAQLDTTTYPLVKFIGGEPYREADLYILLGHPLPNPQETLFTNSTTTLMLRGLDVTKTDTQVAVESYWSAVTPPDRIYSYLVYLSPSNDPNTVLAQSDGQLGQRPTHSWYDPQELLRGEITPLTLPALTDGDYTVWLILYSWETGERFKLADQREALPLLTFTVE